MSLNNNEKERTSVKNEVVVTRRMFYGAIVFVLFAIAPQLLVISNSNNSFLQFITSGIGWYVYIMILGLLAGIVEYILRIKRKVD